MYKDIALGKILNTLKCTHFDSVGISMEITWNR